MKASIFKLNLFLCCILLCNTLSAQLYDPVKWDVSSKKINDCEYDLFLHGIIDEHWHLYSLYPFADEGPSATTLNFVKNNNFELIGKPTESKPIKGYDSIFNVPIAYFEKEVTFTQRVKLKTSGQLIIKGKCEYQICKDVCVPSEKSFEFKLKGDDVCVIVSQSDEASISGKAWWLIYFSGFIWGFAALLTPCVFPLIPLNMTFFLKQSGANGKLNALIYTASIIIIFVALGLLISAIWGGGALLSFSSSAGFNGLVFILLLIFAASFLGAFEITLPSAFVNKIDAQSDKGGFIGIFFMALTLVVVSFSCTGPMVGNALVAASTSQNTSGAFWAMFGFSSGLALPFGFFAFFPSLLGSIPKSGGWLNAIKVVLGFLELALALKFASNVDLVYHLGILTREVFITLWIGIFAMMSIYLLGGFKTAHDSDVKKLTVSRIFIALFSISFTVYLIPGLWGAPLKLLSGILPPYEYSESPHGFGNAEKSNALSIADPEFASYLQTNKNGILHFKNDYEHALAYAKKTGKPLMVDFTGYTCANCRNTENAIWPDAIVKNLLNNEVVLVSLYVDDKRELPPSEVQKVMWNGEEREITTVGDKFKFMQETVYKTNALPFYILLNEKEEPLSEPRFYQSGITEYATWLRNGIDEFKKGS